VALARTRQQKLKSAWEKCEIKNDYEKQRRKMKCTGGVELVVVVLVAETRVQQSRPGSINFII